MHRLAQLADTFNQGAQTHQAVQLAGHIGSVKKIRLKMAEGACIEISGQGVTVQCPAHA